MSLQQVYDLAKSRAYDGSKKSFSNSFTKNKDKDYQNFCIGRVAKRAARVASYFDYQRNSDGFFCLTQACKDLGKEPIAYLKSVPALTIFALHSQSKVKLDKANISTLVEAYPDLIYQQRSPAIIESGIWLDRAFIPSFLEWSGMTREDCGGDKNSSPVELEHIFDEPITRYQFAHPDGLIEHLNIWLRNQDSFIEINGVLDLGRKSLDKLLTSHNFIQILEEAKEYLELDLDYQILNDQSIHYNERTARLYSQLYEVRVIEGKKTVWLHPLVALALCPDSDRQTKVKSAIADNKANQEKNCYITQVSDWKYKAKATSLTNLTALRYPECQISLVDTEDLLALEVRDSQSYWQYLIDLETAQVIVREDLLEFWDLSNRHRTKVKAPRSSDFLATAETTRAREASATIQRFMPQEQLLRIEPEISYYDGSDLGIIRYTKDDKEYRIETAAGFTKSMEYLTRKVRSLFLAESQEPRLKLLEMGYNSLLLEQPEMNIENADIGSMTYKGITIYYRFSDGFVDANSICKIGNKDLRNWLKTDYVWDLFATRAKELGIEFNSSKKTNSVGTRVQRSFASLIERKRGSSKNGGGSWLESELAIQLLIWTIPKFALEVVGCINKRFVCMTKDN